MNNNATSSSSSSSRPLPPDSFKNNLVKAKTAEVDALNPRLASPSSSTPANPNLTNGESPPPKEVPDMSSATFVSVVSFPDCVFRASCPFLQENVSFFHIPGTFLCSPSVHVQLLHFSCMRAVHIEPVHIFASPIAE